MPQICERVGATVTFQRYSKPCRHAHTCGSAPPAGIVATGTRVGSVYHKHPQRRRVHAQFA